MKKSPKISVIMAVYNADMYVSESIESVLNQTFKDFEFIIIDDCSTDNSILILENFKQKDNRIKIVSNETNLGLTKSLNKAIDFSIGKYIARMDADDICLLNRFEEQINFLEQNKEYGLCGSWCENFGDKLGVAKFKIKHNDIKVRLLFQCEFCHPTVMFKSEFFKENKLRYNENFETAQDFELWSRIVNLTKVKNLPFVLLKMRFHHESISIKKKEQQLANRNEIIKQQFYRLGIEVKTDEIDNYIEFCNSNFEFSYTEYNKLVDFISKCVMSNNKSKYIDSIFYYNYLSDLLYHLSFNMKDQKKNVYNKFSNSLFSKSKQFGLLNRCKLYLKLNF